jgi:hypothetical protein
MRQTKPVKYKPRWTSKPQTLVDFMVENTINNQEVGGQERIDRGDRKDEGPIVKKKEHWMLSFDEASKTKTGSTPGPGMP